MKKLPPVLLCLALAAPCAFALPGPGAASYAWGAQLTVDGYDASRPALADFPVLVRIAEGSPSGFLYSQTLLQDGADLCFVDMDGNGLPFEIDTWDPQGTSLVWVTLPTMTNGSEFVMCWGGATSGKTVCSDNPFAGYKGVWHMNQTNVVDASGSGNGGTAAGGVALTNGVVGSGLSYPTTADYVTCGKNLPNSELFSGFTVEGWANLANTSGKHAFFGKDVFMSVRSDGSAVQITTPGIKDHNNIGASLSANTWFHWAMTFVPGNNGLKFYVNGANVNTQSASSLGNQSQSGEMWLARNQWGAGQGFTGLIDEYRLSASIRSADWIAATYATQADPAFLAAGEATPYEATPAPQVGLAAPASAVLYTNATLTASVGSLGKDAAMSADAAWADLLLVVSTNADLSAPLLRESLDRADSAPTSTVRTLVPLATNATYYAKLFATNEFGVGGESSLLSFTTRAPGAPSGTGAFLSRGLTRLSATGAVTDFGTGAESATIRLEASPDGFATLVPSAETNAVPGQSVAFVLDNLEPNTDYALRFRLVNDWGIVAYVPLPETYMTRTGLAALYTFDRSNPFDAVVGSPAKEGTAVTEDTPVTLSDTISALSMVSDPAVLEGRTGVIAVPSYGTLAIPNPGLQKNWTIVLWFYAPESADYHSFFQFTGANNGDASLFIQGDSQIGAGGKYTTLTNGVGETISAIGGWHQLAVSSANNVQTIWFDRQRLAQTRAWNIAGTSLLQFSLDNDGEDAPLYFDEIRLYDETAPEDVFPEGLAAGPVLLGRWTEAPYADGWGSFSRAPDRVIESAPYRVYVFSRHGSVSFTPNRISPDSSLLLVGGGGAGGLQRGGGGGAGGVVSATGVTLGAQTYSFSVGAGGVPDIHRSWHVDKSWGGTFLHEGPTTAGTCGGETTLSDLSGAILHRAAGGGGGGNFNYAGTQLPAESYGLDGASGGGASCKSTAPGRGTAGQGHDGGEAPTDNDGTGGGGGGAGGPGANGTGSVAGAGGGGVTNSITGLPVVYGGGGGASSYERAGGLAGEGGGGEGVSSLGARLRGTASNGIDGLGGGGGGGSGQANNPYCSTGGRGGDGTVILRVLVPEGGDAEPTVAVSATGIGYTNATLDVRLLSLGAGAGSAGVTLRLSANADMSDPFLVTNLATAATAVPVSFAVPCAPLATNALYYARATAVNDRGETGDSALVAFRTLDPGPPAVGLTPAGAGFGTVSATVNLASFGAGSESATVYLDCSLLGDFSDAVSSPGVAVSALPFTQTMTTSGLVPGSNYFYRARAVNTWGVAGVSETFEAVTEAAPVRLSEMSATPAADGTETISVSTLAVEPGTTYSLSISIDGSTVQTWTGQTAPGTFSATYAGSGSHSALARVTCSFRGRTYSDTRSIAFSVGFMRVIVTDYANHCSAATAIRVHAGDTIVLPRLRSGWSYRVLNDRFLALDGLEIVALEPAVAGIEVYNGETLMGTMAVLVLPEAIEGGDVYVYKETVSTGDRIWTVAEAWDKIGSATDSQWPCNTNDIAVIPFHATEGTVYLRHMTDLSLGGILFGQFRDVTAGCILERHKNAGSTKTVTFARTDGEPAFVKVTPNTTAERNNTLRFGGYEILLECASSVETDSCSGPTHTIEHSGGFITYSSCTVHIPEGRYWAIDGLPGYDLNMGGTIGPPTLTGEGVFWKKGMGGLTFGKQNGFHGTLLDTSHGQLGKFDRSAPIFWNGGGGTNVSVTVAGSCHPQLGTPSDSNKQGYGWFRTGWGHFYGAENAHPDVPWNPRKTMTLRGGLYLAVSTQNGPSWGGQGSKSLRLYERLVTGPGMSYARINGDTSNKEGHPTNWVQWDDLDHGDKGTLVIYEPSRRSVAATQDSTNSVAIIKGHDAFLVGAGSDGSCLSSDVYPIIPWIVAPCSTTDSSWRDTLFASFDADGRLTRPVWNNTALDAVASPFSNAYLWDRDIGIGSDVTVNSLFMNNGGKGKLLGEGRTLAIASGGLVMHGGGTAIGQPGGGAENGSLVLGDADHPGYVFAKSSSLDNPNQIWAPVTAPGGFVSSYSGALVLGGSQTNILDELVVNAGVLSLGTAERGCSLAKNLPVRVCAGATLVAPRADAVKKCFLRFDGASGQFGRVELPEGVATQCKRAWWRDFPKTPEWQSLPRGTYGSSDSGVSGEFVRDDLFAGAGTLRVVQDDRIPPTMLILR